MKVSRLIELLQEYQSTYGDTEATGNHEPITEVRVGISVGEVRACVIFTDPR